MAATPHREEDHPILSVATLMAEVRRGARERIGWSRAEDGAAYDEVKRVFQAAQETLAPGSPFYPQVLGTEEEWEVPTPLAFETHRGWLGRGFIWLKRRVLFPLNRWLYGYVWHNLRRQQQLNLRLLAAVEALAASHGRLLQEVRELRSSTLPVVSAPASPTLEAKTAPPPSSERPPMKLAFIVDRYGPDVAGGAERHCRDFAQRLAERGHEVTVLTSCARDYIHWANAFEAGEERDGRVAVRRFRVAKQRDLTAWHTLSRRVFAGLGSSADEHLWFEMSGPFCPDLIDHLKAVKDQHDLFIFVSYRYYPTFAGLPVVAPRAILLPTAEEDPAMRIAALRDFFTKPLGIIHNTIEEHEMMRAVVSSPLPAFAVIGSGVDAPVALEDGEGLLHRRGVTKPFILCLGRVDPNKGSATLLADFRRYVAFEGERVELVMAGESVEDMAPSPGVRFLGRVSEEERVALLQHAQILVAPSPFESLSLALLEAWMHGKPALVNGWCKVLRGQVTRANGGLCYENAAEFREALNLLLDRPKDAARLGAQGRAHARQEYSWPVVVEKLEAFLQERRSRAL